MEVVGVVLAYGPPIGSLDGSTLIDHAASALRGSGVVASVLVSTGPSAHAALHGALSALGSADVVVLHDAHRPLAPADLVVRVVEAMQAGVDAVVPVVEVTETVKEVDLAGRIVRTVPREALVQLQTPQAVRGPLLRSGHRRCSPGDPLVPAAARTVTVPGAADAVAVHDAHDLLLAAAVRAVRAG